MPKNAQNISPPPKWIKERLVRRDNLVNSYPTQKCPLIPHVIVSHDSLPYMYKTCTHVDIVPSEGNLI